MSKFNQLKTVFFDLDDTLWDHQLNQLSALKIVHQALHLPGDFVEFHQVYHEENEKAWSKYRAGEYTPLDVRFQRFYRTLTRFSTRSESLANEADSLYRKVYPYQPHLLEGAHEILDLLGKHFQLGLISNGFKELQEIKLQETELKAYFDPDLIIYSEIVGKTKPHPDIFLYALDRAHCQTSEALYIGDDYKNDIEAAQKLGINTLYLLRDHTALDENSFVKPSSVIHSLLDITSHLF